MKKILVAAFAFSLCTGEVQGREINTLRERESQPVVNLHSVSFPKKINWIEATENVSHRARIASGLAILAGSHALRAACVATRLAPLCFPMFPVSILHNKFYTFAGHMIVSKTSHSLSNGVSRVLSTVKELAKENICSSNSGWLESFTRKKTCFLIFNKGSSVIKSLGLSEMNLSNLTGNKTYQFVINNLFMYAGWLGSIAINWKASFLVRWLYDISCGGIDLGRHVIAERRKDLELEKVRKIEALLPVLLTHEH